MNELTLVGMHALIMNEQGAVVLTGRIQAEKLDDGVFLLMSGDAHTGLIHRVIPMAVIVNALLFDSNEALEDWIKAHARKPEPAPAPAPAPSHDFGDEDPNARKPLGSPMPGGVDSV